MQVFDGVAFATNMEAEIAQRVRVVARQGSATQIVSLVFREDAGSKLYTEKKHACAQRLGIPFAPEWVSLTDSVDYLVSKLYQLSQVPQTAGLMIQKPRRKTWIDTIGQQRTFVTTKEAIRAFDNWWLQLTSSIDPSKDVDGLTPTTQAAIQAGTWREQGRVLPATAQAILAILQSVPISQSDTIAVLGKSDIVGRPTYYALKHLGYQTDLLGSADFNKREQSGAGLRDFSVVISATGKQHLISSQHIAPDSLLIDVGEPYPDFDFNSVSQLAQFITPVPGGVGPVTVAQLFANLVTLLESNTQ